MTGTVIRSINNIYSVKTENGEVYSCRIKGKQLEQAKGEYNPIVVGDSVEFSQSGTLEGMVTHRNDRKSYFSRWNMKAQLDQVICANMDLLICVCSVESPPFRPRFADRVIACTQGVPIVICLNKSDIKLDSQEKERFKLYSLLGYETIAVSAETGKGIAKLKKILKGKTCALVGQSGVGKSSLVNALLGTDQRVGDVSEKFNRGCHTTTSSIMLEGEDFVLIDTPGFREISVPHADVHKIADSFPEFVAAKHDCAFDSCLHVNEPNCEVIRQVQQGIINADRYESYLRMLDTIQEHLQYRRNHVQKNS